WQRRTNLNLIHYKSSLHFLLIEVQAAFLCVPIYFSLTCGWNVGGSPTHFKCHIIFFDGANICKFCRRAADAPLRPFHFLIHPKQKLHSIRIIVTASVAVSIIHGFI
ncbi:hypothetical protein, partial [Kingella kingae]|uniref:hypothetical protein n=1 Tax=Kingella kingae TaxID=504 RepID=UPI00254C1E34